MLEVEITNDGGIVITGSEAALKELAALVSFAAIQGEALRGFRTADASTRIEVRREG